MPDGLSVLPDPGDFDYDGDEPLPDGAPATPARIEASDTSSLGTVRERLRKAKEERTLPKWVLEPDGDVPGVLVEYGPIGWEELEAIRKAHKKAGPRAGILTACDIAIATCLGIYLSFTDDPARRDEWEHMTDDAPTTFASAELGEYLSEPEAKPPVIVKTARQCVRSLYATDGDVMAVGDHVVKFSGYLGEDEANRPN